MATWRLPAEVRPAVHAVYGFVRGADEIVDGAGRAPTAAARRAALDAWEGHLFAGRVDHPVIGALVDAAPRHGLPLGELRTYMDSMRTDCGPVRMQGRDALERYVRGSAEAVGLVLAPLLAAPPDALARMGAAFQLTNFVRDVREDWALDRIYLPGVTAADLDRPRASGVLRERVADEVMRARGLFASTADAVAALPPRLRPGVRLARSVYERILDRIERSGFDVLGARTALTPVDLLRR